MLHREYCEFEKSENRFFILAHEIISLRYEELAFINTGSDTLKYRPEIIRYHHKKFPPCFDFLHVKECFVNQECCFKIIKLLISILRKSLIFFSKFWSFDNMALFQSYYSKTSI